MPHERLKDGELLCKIKNKVITINKFNKDKHKFIVSIESLRRYFFETKNNSSVELAKKYNLSPWFINNILTKIIKKQLW